MAQGFGSLLTHAKRAAQRRGQKLTTAHLLLALLELDEPCRSLLSRLGMREIELLTALKVVDGEGSSAVEVTLERAVKVASKWGDGSPIALHLLMAMATEPRLDAHRCLGYLGMRPTQVTDEVQALLEGSMPFATPPPSAALSSGRGNPSPGSGGGPIPARPPARLQRSVREASQARLPVAPRRPTRAPELPVPEVPSLPSADALASALSERLPCAEEAAPRLDGDEARSIPAPPRPVRANRRVRAPAPSDPADAGVQAHWFLSREEYPLLNSIGRNLSQAAAEGQIDPVVGREQEIERLLDVLARRRANNPVLVGPAGVGKTAIVEGLARRLDREAHTADACGLSQRVLIEISAGSLVAGTGVRGALADKLRALRDEVTRSQGRVLLFIDEIHALVGGDGPDDVATELKAALARGELPCIGATTDVEYRRIFERDAALARRFTRVEVDEPKPDVALQILRGVQASYETHHRVAYAPEALSAAVDMSVRYLSERQLPDKAIGLLDQAAARARRRGERVVDEAAVAQVVSELARVPLDRLLMNDGERLLVLEEDLAERVVGQQDAIARIAEALRKSAAGFRGRRPLGTFLFLGPTGVGKTEMAKAISELVFLSTDMSRFDMSEMSEAHAVARLLGAPPGYVGHDEGGQLTEAVRRAPYQLILLDEIEKAHPDVLLALLPLLDEGHLTDARGRTVDFTNCIIVMTSNLGADATARERGRIGFSEGSDAAARDAREECVLRAARHALPPELWNRIDEPLCFHALGRAEVACIAQRLLRGVSDVMLAQHRVTVVFPDSIIDVLVEQGGYDATLGARPMRRVVGRLIEAPLASLVLKGGIAPGQRWTARPDGLRVVFEPVDEAAE